MYRVRLSLLAFVLCLASLAVQPRSAEAQIIPRSLEVDIMGGYYFWGGNLENLRNGPFLGGRLGINFLENVSFEATLGYVPTSTVHGSRQAHYLLPHFDVVIHMTPWRVVPYFAVGAGFRYMQIDEAYMQGIAPEGELLRDPYLSDDQVNCPAGESCNLRYEYRDTDFVFDVGGGIKFLIFDRGGIRLDARYVFSIGPGGSEDGVPAWEDRQDGSQAVVWNDQFHHAELTGSVFFLLGGGAGKDSDSDGIPDRKDECKDSPEDRDDFQDEDGCPDIDNDQDGVPDEDDRCPDLQEDRDGWKDNDGCPDTDNDGDGLLDSEDACPNKTEDIDGHQDGDGCPEPDNDSDGIPDTRDQCPIEPEDKDGFRDDDGCPEPDNDGDGILDAVDKCPNAAEELNGIEDADGCPEQDGDGDGVYDGRDRCPSEAEDLDGFEDQDGCPDPDNDSDGLLDNVDQCPSTPEDKDGWDDGDGCPDHDNDDDGLPDGTDTCPNKAEDDDGFEDTDGCPDLDNDQDGILDDADKCSNHAETINGFEDLDGCPDTIPEKLKKFTGVIPNINFKSASDELLSSSFPTLDRAAEVLNEFTAVRFEIQGHASSEGDDEYNLKLSRKRAEAVREYLIDRGVSAERLRAQGYGETIPLSTNRSEAGRSKNRRVEFQILQD